jgi:hypothetical protein
VESTPRFSEAHKRANRRQRIRRNVKDYTAPIAGLDPLKGWAAGRPRRCRYRTKTIRNTLTPICRRNLVASPVSQASNR